MATQKQREQLAYARGVKAGIAQAHAQEAKPTRTKATAKLVKSLSKDARKAFRTQAGIPAGMTIREWTDAQDVRAGKARKAAHNERVLSFAEWLRGNGYDYKHLLAAFSVAPLAR